MTTKTAVKIGVPLVVLAVIAAIVIPRMSAQNAPGWLVQDDDWAQSKATLQAFGACLGSLIYASCNEPDRRADLPDQVA